MHQTSPLPLESERELPLPVVVLVLLRRPPSHAVQNLLATVHL